MTSQRILQLENILQLKNTEILSQKVTSLTKAGDNYGSVLLRVDLEIKTGNEIQQLYLVAKVLPDRKTQEIFQSAKTFRNELYFYKNIIPILQKFKKENGMEVSDIFPKFYGGRLNLTNNLLEVDENVVILLENLHMKQFKLIERTEGFDLNSAKIVLSSLAEFHAVPLAFRLRNSDLFNKEIFPYLAPWRMDMEFHNNTKKQLEKIIDSLPELKLLKERILQGYDKKLIPSKYREPFATIVHNDFWVNNNMVKYEDNKPIKHKIFDFQVCTFASLSKDLMFFLFSSVRNEIVEEFYEELLHTYYNKFTNVLLELKCEIAIDFDDFIKECDIEAVYSQFGHLVLMLNPIFAKEGVKCTAHDLLNQELTDLHKAKLVFIAKEFARRKWI